MKQHLENFRSYLILTNHPVSTQKSYLSSMRLYLDYCQLNRIEDPLTESSIKQYLLYRHQQKLNWKTVNLDYSSLKMYITKVQKGTWDITNLPRPKTKREIPNVISVSEVEKLISHTSILKYRTLIIFMYTTGMRLSEALEVRVQDIDSSRQKVKVRLGKGQRDRYVDIPMILIEILREYYKIYRPKEYLFYGEVPQVPIHERTFQSAIKKAGKQAGILKVVTPHTLRHCYATHHMENGTNIVYVQKMLGHSNLKTTSIYLHLCANIPEIQINHPIKSLQIDLMKGVKI